MGCAIRKEKDVSQLQGSGAVGPASRGDTARMDVVGKPGDSGAFLYLHFLAYERGGWTVSKAPSSSDIPHQGQAMGGSRNDLRLLPAQPPAPWKVSGQSL